MSRSSSRFALLMGLMLFLGGTMSGVSEVRRVEAIGTIYIRPDGSIVPSTAPIQRFREVYTLTGNITSEAGGITVERDNIIFDGAGYTVKGMGSGRGIDISHRSNVTVKNFNVLSFGQAGIYLSFSSNNSITQNNVTANDYSIVGYSSENNNILENMAKENRNGGIYLYSLSNYNIVCRNDISSNKDFGLNLDYSSDNDVCENDITLNNGTGGLHLRGAQNNSICGNNIAKNAYGVYCIESSNNNIYNNNLLDNTQQLYDGAWYYDLAHSVNTWDGGYPSGGNYRSDYTDIDIQCGPYQNETSGDGIGDAHYIIDANNTDNYPLMGMFSDFNATSEHHVQTICNSSLSNFQFNGTAIGFYVTGDSGTAGFCRICIPTALMNATCKVYVNSTEVSYNLLPCSNETHSYLYFNYKHSTKEVVIIPEFPSFLVLPLFVATLLAVVVYRRKPAQRERLD